LEQDPEVGGLFEAHFLTQDMVDAGTFPEITV
jgi:hypothetical protein